MPSTPTTEPEQIRAGDSCAWTRTVDGYPASAGWALAYRLVPLKGGSPIAIGSTPSGDAFAVSLASNITSGYAAGAYKLVGVVTKGSERYTINESACRVLPDPLAATAADGRSNAQTIVDNIDAWLRGRNKIAGAQQVGDRRIQDHPLPDLIRLRDYYAAQAASERAAENLAKGLGAAPGRVLVRM